LYSDSVDAASDLLRRPPAEEKFQVSLKDGAACRDASAAPSRPTPAMVRCDSKMARPVYCQTIPLIIPNAFMGAFCFLPLRSGRRHSAPTQIIAPAGEYLHNKAQLQFSNPPEADLLTKAGQFLIRPSTSSGTGTSPGLNFALSVSP